MSPDPTPAPECPAGDDGAWVAPGDGVADARRGPRPGREGVYMQRFAIDFEYLVCFTSNLFTPSIHCSQKS